MKHKPGNRKDLHAEHRPLTVGAPQLEVRQLQCSIPKKSGTSNTDQTRFDSLESRISYYHRRFHCQTHAEIESESRRAVNCPARSDLMPIACCLVCESPSQSRFGISAELHGTTQRHTRGRPYESGPIRQSCTKDSIRYTVTKNLRLRMMHRTRLLGPARPQCRNCLPLRLGHSHAMQIGVAGS